ncbi:unnamed protein product [Rotaria sordida]|uniref:Poly [ADP-ribose] polymerase n=1 Tax=Rotaria sordida TaxID=392033 RepID=A0A814G6R8_9BILA|nr:unnamed protein product [Rotaria sordida]
MAEAIRETILCQYCNTLINFQDWTEHSEQCTNAHKCRVENLKNGIDNEPINILVPCEYCNKQVNAHDLEWHTRQCADKYRRQIQKLQNNETTLVPCEYCNAQVNALEWELHTNGCIEAERQMIGDLTKHTAIDPSDEQIPCEYCNKCYSIHKIESHQKRCRHKQSLSAFQPNALHDEVFGTIYSLPKHWDLSALNNLTRYILDPETEEYKFVANNFHQTLPLNQIVQIERIQNRRWYRQYDAHKEDFIERYGKSTERWLFHGCRESRSAEAIIHDCFNRSHAVNCAAGQGIYFATQAMISHGYTQPDANRLRHMFMARVLVGRTTVGSSSMRICPPGFDTTGGGNVFVTYHDAQAYGEYLIVYK